MIENIKNGLSDGQDASDLDGYEDLSEELQTKVRKAFEVGHVDDEDWKGVSSNLLTRYPHCLLMENGPTTAMKANARKQDVEFNRPGKTGMRARKTKAEKEVCRSLFALFMPFEILI